MVEADNSRDRKTILIVDDVASNVALLAQLLSRWGCQAKVASSGKLALQFLQVCTPDLILLDVRMPGMSGYEVCRRLKLQPGSAAIPVIFTSASEEVLDKVKAFEAGGVDYIVKPFEPTEVLARIKNQLKIKAQNDQLKQEVNQRQAIEKQLRASEERWQLALQGNNDGIWDWDITSDESFRSPWFAEVLGYDLQKMGRGNREFLQLIHPADRERVLTTQQAYLSQQIPYYSSEYRLRCANGTYKWVISRGQAQWDEAGKPLRMVGSVRDISERKQREIEIRLLLDITRAIAKVSDLESALATVLAMVCQTISWDYGEVWMPNENSTVLQLGSGWCGSDPNIKKFRQQSLNLTFAPDQGLPGRIWSSRQPEVFLHSQAAASVGLKAGFGVPIMSGENILSVLVFFNKTYSEPQDHTIELVGAVAAQLGPLIQRKQAEEKTEKLLLNILPQPIAERLQKKEEIIADSFEEVSVLFADLVGFTSFAARVTPYTLVEILNQIFSRFDQLALSHNLEKIKTIGDAYMVVGGLPEYQPRHIEAIAQMALDMQAAIASLSQRTGEHFLLRIGIHVGSVVAGVIGLSKFSYDLWGDTVNVASRMESTGLPGKIQVTAPVKERLEKQFIFEQRGEVNIKGKGRMTTYLLRGKK